ncbi:MAG: 3'-5' exonuclease [Chloroflexota bacterium]
MPASTPLERIRDEMAAYICVDVETAGGVPDQYALLSIGACTIARPRQTFYIELQPDRDACDPQAMAIHGLSLDALRRHGVPPARALEQFEAWIKQMVPAPLKPIFVAFNAPFDWMFMHTYFLRYLQRDPFGHKALDIKAFYMGMSGKPWQRTSGAELHRLVRQADGLTHNALQDALDQADLFEKLLDQIEPGSLSSSDESRST